MNIFHNKNQNLSLILKGKNKDSSEVNILNFQFKVTHSCDLIREIKLNDGSVSIDYLKKQ